MNAFLSFLVGLLFAIGLGISQLTNPAKILGFLNVLGNWDPTLLVVMVAALASYYFFFRIVSKSPHFDWSSIPSKKNLDAPLLLGAALFGIGWGLIGFCPGPALTALASGKNQVLVFVAAMTLGIWTFQAFQGKIIPPQ